MVTNTVKVTLENGQLQFGFRDLLDALDDEAKRELSELLIWDKELFDEFIEALATDKVVTESYNSYVYGARLRLVELLPEMNRNIVRSLLRELEAEKEERRRHNSWAWKLYHAWHEDERPKMPEFIHTGFKSNEEVDAYIVSRTGDGG